VALSFRQIFQRELDAINFRRRKIKAGEVRAVREQELSEIRRAAPQPTDIAGDHYLRDRSEIRLAERLPASEMRSARLAGESDLTGLAFSGGGIRSASFCLGVLQGLDSLTDHSEPHVLDAIDYLSVVSGGSYIGTSLVAAMMQPDYSFPFDSRLDDQETPETLHLRDFSNFLVPNRDYRLSHQRHFGRPRIGCERRTHTSSAASTGGDHHPL
jgi:predicted acylesterase/phospholipase RssA